MSKDKLTTQELTDLLAHKASVSKKMGEDFLKAFFLTIEESLLANDFVKIKNFGTFKLQWNEARKSINVRTGEEIQIEGFSKVVFIPDSKLKELVNEPYAHLEALQLDNDVQEIKTESVETAFSPLHIFTEQASEIKDILSEINALSVIHSNTESDIEKAEIVLPIEEQQDYFDTATENLNDVEAVEINTAEDDIKIEETKELVLLDINEDEKELESTSNETLEKVEKEIVADEIEDVNTEYKVVDFGINEEQMETELIKNANPETIDDEIVDDEIVEMEKETVINGQLINEVQPEPELIQRDNSVNELDTETIMEEHSVPVEVKNDVTDNTIDAADEKTSSLDEPDSDEPVIPVVKSIKKNGCFILLIVNTLLIIAFVVNYYLSSATRCWIKYTLLSEQNLDKVSNLKATSSDWFNGVKSWFDKKPSVESKEPTIYKYKVNPAESTVPKAISDSTQDTLTIDQNNLESIDAKSAIDTVKVKPKSSGKTEAKAIIEKTEMKVKPVEKTDTKIKPVEKNETMAQPDKNADSLKKLFDGPRVYTSFLGTEKINEGSRLTWISAKYYGLKDFWVYIYEANKSLIENPDRIPTGIEIKIPKLDKRLIDKNNPQCLQKAKELHDLYVGKK